MWYILYRQNIHQNTLILLQLVGNETPTYCIPGSELCRDQCPDCANEGFGPTSNYSNITHNHAFQPETNVADPTSDKNPDSNPTFETELFRIRPSCDNNFRFVTEIDRQVKLPDLLKRCAPITKLPYNISTTVNTMSI